MRLPVVPRSELERLRAERDAWRNRAELSLAVSHAPTVRRARRRRRPGAAQALLAGCMLVSGVALGALTLAPSSGTALEPDYPGCIGKARYEEPIRGNQYQELVNALYACGVYELP